SSEFGIEQAKRSAVIPDEKGERKEIRYYNQQPDAGYRDLQMCSKGTLERGKHALASGCNIQGRCQYNTR
uniref:hypothetical protein n=1 Tax=Parablautia intestinalis TaxID=2320100 RepID=UPI00259CA4BE